VFSLIAVDNEEGEGGSPFAGEADELGPATQVINTAW
jgi:hypothetical protein